MKVKLLLLVLLIALSQSQAAVITDKQSIEGKFTCDILSISVAGFQFNHAACALHCMLIGYNGGACGNNAICYCRWKTKTMLNL